MPRAGMLACGGAGKRLKGFAGGRRLKGETELAWRGAIYSSEGEPVGQEEILLCPFS